MDKMKLVEATQMKSDVPAFGPGDTITVHVRVVEGDKERIQLFQGVVISRRNRGLNSNFIVRKISSGEGVERTFQLYSPLIASIEVKRRGDVRRVDAPSERVNRIDQETDHEVRRLRPHRSRPYAARRIL